MNKKTINIILAIFYIISLVFYWVRPLGTYNELGRNIVYLLAPLMAVAFSMYLSAIFGSSGKRARVFRLMVLGILFLFIGEFSYVYFDFITRTKPFPSLADVFYLTSYPFILLGIISEILSVRPSIKKLKKSSIILGALIFIVVFICVAYFGVFLAFDPNAPLVNNIISISYGVGDLIIIGEGILLYLLAKNTRGGVISNFWLQILIGFIFILCGDILFAKFNDLYSATDYFYKNTLDSFWILGYTVLASAFISLALETKSIQEKISKDI